MYSVSEVAKQIGVARSTLLYYEKIMLIVPARHPSNGYRVYSHEDLNQLVILKQLQKAGLTLSECRRFIDGKPDMKLVEERLTLLEQELFEIKMARDLLRTIYYKGTGNVPSNEVAPDNRKWHVDFEKRAANAHFSWLQKMGFSAKEALHIRWASKNMTDTEVYMDHFFQVFENMKRQGPGSSEATLKALNSIPEPTNIKKILEIGSGSGAASLVLAEKCDAMITAIDNHQPFLDRFKKEITRLGYESRLKLINMDMYHLDFHDEYFDLIWAEGSAYFLGFESALEQWKRFIRKNGFLFISDAVWLTDNPSQESKDYWNVEYPQMTTPSVRKKQAKELGYDVLDMFILPRQDWQVFYKDMEKKLTQAIKNSGMNRTFRDMEKEIRVDKLFGHEYSYVCMILRKKQGEK